MAIDAVPRRIGEMLLGDGWSQTSRTVLPTVLRPGTITLTAGSPGGLAPWPLDRAPISGRLGTARGTTAGCAVVSSPWWPAMVPQSGRQTAGEDPQESRVEQDELRHDAGRRSMP